MLTLLIVIGFTHHMAKDDSLFSSLKEAIEKEIFVVDDYALNVVVYGNIECKNGMTIDMYHVHGLSANFLSIP